MSHTMLGRTSEGHPLYRIIDDGYVVVPEQHHCASCGRMATGSVVVAEQWGYVGTLAIPYDDSFYCPACAVLEVE